MNKAHIPASVWPAIPEQEVAWSVEREACYARWRATRLEAGVKKLKGAATYRQRQAILAHAAAKYSVRFAEDLRQMFYKK